MLQIEYDFDDKKMQKCKKDLAVLGGYSLKFTIIYVLLGVVLNLLWGWIIPSLDARIALNLLWLSLIPGFLYWYNMTLIITFGAGCTSMLWRRHRKALLITYIILLSGTLYFGFQANELLLTIITIIASFLPIKYITDYHIDVTIWAMKKYYEEKQETPQT